MSKYVPVRFGRGKMPWKPTHRVWYHTRQKKLGVFGRSDLADAKQFSKKTKAGQKRRIERATELKARRKVRGMIHTKGRYTVGSPASETYDNIKKLYRGYGGR